MDMFVGELKCRAFTLIQRLLNENRMLLEKIVAVKPLSEKLGFEFTVLGVKYKVALLDGELELDVEDPLERKEDYSRLIVYMLNAIKRALEGRLTSHRSKLTMLTTLPGGETVRLYEKRIVNFLAAELSDASLKEIGEAAKMIGGSIVEHPSASWSVEVIPFNGVRINIAYWQGEEEIPAGAVLLVGEEAKEVGVPIEELLAVAEMTVNRFVLFYRRETGRKPKLYRSLYI